MKRPVVQSPPLTVTSMQWLNRHHLDIRFSNQVVMLIAPFIARTTGQVVGLKHLELHFRGGKVFGFVGELEPGANSGDEHRLVFALPTTEPRTLARFWQAATEHLDSRRNELLRSGIRARALPNDLDRAWAVFSSRNAKRDLEMLQAGGTHR